MFLPGWVAAGGYLEVGVAGAASDGVRAQAHVAVQKWKEVGVIIGATANRIQIGSPNLGTRALFV